jgi:hypothetical protein
LYTALTDYEKFCDKVIRIKVFDLSMDYTALYHRRQISSKYYTFLWESHIQETNEDNGTIETGNIL